jgi:XTP/dITP diphosphohydrolase
VFEAGAAATDVAQLTVDWERRKVEEKGRDSVMDGIPAALPALAYAAKVQKKAESQGVPWRTLLAEGDDDLAVRLLELVDEARATGADPETELRSATQRLRQAFDARATR